MRKLFLLILTLVNCSFLHSSSPERVERLSSKVILQNTDGYFVLSDGSCWKTVGFSKRWRSLVEWWNGVQLVPENYECLPNDWYLGTEIEIFQKYDNLEVSEADAANQEVLRQCTHLMVNARNGQVLFAIALHPTECIIQLFDEAYTDGYNSGFNKGRLSSYQKATDIYNKGFADGHKDGYAEGYQKGQRGK